VTLTRGYYVSIGEVTNAQYRRWKGAHDSGTKFFNGETQPVVEVSHADATGYAAWLSAQDGGRTYRLPTEAEWEYACRAGTTTPFWFGATITPEQANYDGDLSYGRGPKGASRKRATPVGTFAPNGWGLYDVHGNVWEWCADWYGAYPAGRIQDPQGPSTGSERVQRGGAWRDDPDFVRSANRLRRSPGSRGDDAGFRLVLVAPPG
jgi:formylglycine-generating enzyme required for sulfatase activity